MPFSGTKTNIFFGVALAFLRSNLRSTGTLHGILVYGGGPGHVVRIDDAKVMVDDAVGAEASAWGNLKALYR